MVKRNRGFTLIEVLVAATIIAVLVAIGTVSYSSINRRSRDARRKSDIEQIRSALEQYRTDKGVYPPTGSGNWTLVTTLDAELSGSNGYISTIPKDPKTGVQEYWYEATNQSASSYYGYCLTAYIEATIVADDTCPGGGKSDTIPTGGAVYAVRNP